MDRMQESGRIICRISENSVLYPYKHCFFIVPAGRPLKFQSVEELQEKIEEYFSKCKTEGKKPIISGLALHLDTTRETLCDYRDKDEYSYSIKRAKQRCEAILEENLVEGKVNPTGTIFNLKNNYGWKDKTEQDLTTKGESLNDMSYARARSIISGKESDTGYSEE